MTMAVQPDPGPVGGAQRAAPPTSEERPAPPPVLTRANVLAASTAGLFVIALFGTLYFARSLFVPIAVALLFNLLLGAFVRRLERLRIPSPVGAAVVLLTVLGVLGAGVWWLSGPAADWMERAPQTLSEIRIKLAVVRDTLQGVQEATEQVQKVAEGAAETTVPAAPVIVQGPGMATIFVGGTARVLASAVVTLILLYFLLASGDLFLLKLVQVLPRLQDKKRAVEIAHQVERDISAYLVTITAVNAGLGVVTGLAMWALGLPNPFLWGAVAGVLNFVPYLGAMTTLVIIAAVSVLSLPTLGAALVPPIVFLVMTTLEGQLITPMLLGRRLTLNPVVIFIALLVWGWLWGVAGILLAVPLLAMGKILCDHLPRLAPIGQFLGRRE